MSDRADINRSYGGRQSGEDGAAIQSAMGGARITASAMAPWILGNGTWNDNGVWYDDATWRDS